MIFGAIGSMLGEQVGIHSVIYPFGYVMYTREWSKIPQQRLFGRAAEDHRPWCNIFHFIAEFIVCYRHFFSMIF